jgi:hypothetical protein
MVFERLLHFYIIGVEGNRIRGGEGGGVGDKECRDTNKQCKEGENDRELSVFEEGFK